MKQVIVFVISVLVFSQIGNVAAVSDTKKAASDKPNLISLKKEMVLTKKYLVFPMRYERSKVRFSIVENGKSIRGGGFRLNGKNMDDWWYIDIADLNGKKVAFQVDNYNPDTDGGWDMIKQSDVFDPKLPGGCDPKIIWYEPNKTWVIAYYDADKELGAGTAFYSSKDMKNWKYESKFKGPYECPELFEIAVDGDENNKKWVTYGARGIYYIGNFDGHKFVSDYETGFPLSRNGVFYASQTWNNVPESDGRRIQIAWGRFTPKGSQWSQQMFFPVELTLRTTDAGIRMFANPVREIESLYKDKTYQWENLKLEKGKDVSFDIDEEFLDMTFVLKVSDDAMVHLNLHGQKQSYGKWKRPLYLPKNGRIKVRILKDATSIETYAFDGEVYKPVCMTIAPDKRELIFSLQSGTCEIESFEAHGLKLAVADQSKNN